MAEAFGIASGVLGLVPLCAQGCELVEGICNAHGGVEEQKTRVHMQRIVSSKVIIICNETFC